MPRGRGRSISEMRNSRNRQNLETDQEWQSTFLNTLQNTEAEMAQSEAINNLQMIALLPDIFGRDGENFTNKFKQIKDIAQLAGWSETQLAVILKTKLKERAYDLFTRSTKLQNAVQAAEIIKLITDHFQNALSDSQKQSKFEGITQKPGQNIQDLALEIQNAAEDYLGNAHTDAEILGKIKFSKFIQAVRPDIRKELIRSKTRDFDIAVKESIEWEKIFTQEETELLYNLNNVKAISQENEIQALKDKIQKLELQSKQEIKYCEVCLKPGHELKDCWHVANIRQRNSGQDNYQNVGASRGRGYSHFASRGNYHNSNTARTSQNNHDRFNRRGQVNNGRYQRGTFRPRGNLNF